MFAFPFRRGLLLAGLLLGLSSIAAAAPAARTILVLGDSLSAGYGIHRDAAWPSLLSKRLQEKGLDYNVVNVSISGETSSGGRRRIGAALRANSPRVVIVALGANDGLRGLPVGEMKDNLEAIVAEAQRGNAKVLLVGQRVPPNYGAYAARFQKAFGEVARTRKTAFVDFLLDGIATQPRFFQADNLHPTADAQPLLLDNVWRGLAPLLK
jgi:acyl-CoA thioesterase-1